MYVKETDGNAERQMLGWVNVCVDSCPSPRCFPLGETLKVQEEHIHISPPI